MAIGVMLGGVLQLAVQVPALARVGCLPRIALTPGGIARAWRHPGVGLVLRQMAPAVLGVSVAQIALAYLLQKPQVASVIIGARTDEQLADNLAAAKVRLAADEVAGAPSRDRAPERHRK